MKSKLVKQYLKEVKRNLVCEAGVKGFVLKELRQSIDAFAQEKGAFSDQELRAEFGDPKEYALHLADRKDFPEILKMARKKVRLWRCIGMAALVLLIIIALITAYIIYKTTGTITISDQTVIECIERSLTL